VTDEARRRHNEGADARAEPDSTRTDGRTARRDRNREAVLDAMIGLIEEGDATPTVVRISERSGVSHRSVYRYFDDLSELYAEAALRAFERYAPLSRVSGFGRGTLDSRIDALIDQRLVLFPAFAPLACAARVRPETSAFVIEVLDGYLAPLAEQTAHQFAPELDALSDDVRRERLTAMVVLLSFDAYDFLARRGTDNTTMRAVYSTGIRALLAG
jgi:AcrR family transcriptional regulator